MNHSHHKHSDWRSCFLSGRCSTSVATGNVVSFHDDALLGKFLFDSLQVSSVGISVAEPPPPHSSRH